MIPWFGPHLTGDESAFLSKALDSGWINDGPLTREFEATFAKFIGRRYAVAVSNCTSSLALCLMAAGVGLGDEVIVPDLTFIATANAVRLTGANVCLVDVKPTNFTIDPVLVEKAFNKRTRAVIAVDVNGRGCDWRHLQQVCVNNDIRLIFDCAEALGSSYGLSYMGSHGLAACFSFSANKTISSGQGGMIVTDVPDFWRRLCQLKDQGRAYPGTGGDDDHPVVGFNFKFTDLQAAVALAQWEHLPSRLDKAEARDDYYLHALGLSPGALPGEVLQWTDVLVGDREKVTAALDKAKIGYRRFWKPLHTQLPYQTDEEFPISTEISRKGLWLPSRYDLTEPDLKLVCDTIAEALEKSYVLQSTGTA